MDEFSEILQNMVNEDYDTLLKIAQENLVILQPACKAVDEENEGMLMMTGILLAATAADGVISAKEKQFIMDALALDEEAFNNFEAMFTPEFYELTDKFADSMPTEIKAATISLVAAIAACDEKISREETIFLRKLLE